MRRAPRFAPLAACLAALVTSFAPGAAAEYRHRVVLLERGQGSEADHEITTRVRAELGAAGFEVILLEAAEPDPKQAVEAAGRELHPASVLLVERLAASVDEPSKDSGTELWLADRMLRKTVVLRLKAEPTPAAGEAGDARSRRAARIAVQAVELVKARLAELSLTRERETRAAPAAPVPRPRPAAPETRGARPNLTAALGMLEGFQEGQQALTPVLRRVVTLP